MQECNKLKVAKKRIERRNLLELTEKKILDIFCQFFLQNLNSHAGFFLNEVDFY